MSKHLRKPIIQGFVGDLKYHKHTYTTKTTLPKYHKLTINFPIITIPIYLYNIVPIQFLYNHTKI